MTTDNSFYVDQCVVCINDNFPMVITTGDKSRIGTHADACPKIGEVLSIDEILGEFIRFDKYDCHDETHPDYGWRWFKHTHFRAATENETEDYFQQIAKGFMRAVFGLHASIYKTKVNNQWDTNTGQNADDIPF